MERCRFRPVAFVFMPEHVHLLVDPLEPQPELDRLLFAIKRPVSFRITKPLESNDSPLLKSLTIHERPGKTTFRLRQEGPGYDRNLSTERAVLAAIDDIHLNPVRRGLVAEARLWRWSSSRWYESDGRHHDASCPRFTD